MRAVIFTLYFLMFSLNKYYWLRTYHVPGTSPRSQGAAVIKTSTVVIYLELSQFLQVVPKILVSTLKLRVVTSKYQRQNLNPNKCNLKKKNSVPSYAPTSLTSVISSSFHQHQPYLVLITSQLSCWISFLSAYLTSNFYSNVLFTFTQLSQISPLKRPVSSFQSSTQKMSTAPILFSSRWRPACVIKYPRLYAFGSSIAI